MADLCRLLGVVGALVCCLASARTQVKHEEIGAGGSGPPRFFIEAKGNAFATKGEAMRDLHRQAAELCSARGYSDYELRDTESDDVYVTTTGGHTLRKPGYSAIVVCR